VDGVSKVNRRGTARKLKDLAFGSENINFVREQIDFYMFDKLQRVVCALAHLDKPLNPAIDPTLADLNGGGIIVLIEPVRCNPVVGDLLHFLGADLNLDIHVHAEQGGMQRLVAVRLGHRNVIFEAARQGLIEAVHSAQNAITIVS